MLRQPLTLTELVVVLAMFGKVKLCRTVLTTMSEVRDRCRKLMWNLPMLLSCST